jgi:methanogenic corrinoid protein MtbC1
MDDRRENDTRESRLAALSRAFARALVTGDEIEAEQTVRDAMDAGLSTPDIDDEIIAPGLWLIGELWERGEISIADEHLATEIALRVIALQREAQRVKWERPDHRVMLAAPAGEHHIVALRMVANLLRGAGYGSVLLGGDMPPDTIAAAAQRHEPSIVCLSATMPGGADHVLVAIHEIEQAWPVSGFVVGGRGVHTHLRARPGIEICNSVTEAVGAVDALVRRASLN